MNKGIVKESKDGRFKIFRSENYNYNFDKRSGEFARWGKTTDEDPLFSPFGPEIMDIEISEGESCPMTCGFCSPAGTLINTPNGKIPIENINENDLVIGFNIETGSPQIQSIKETYHRPYVGELVCIELSNGKILKLTPNHEIFTKNRGWIMSKELTEIDDIVSF